MPLTVDEARQLGSEKLNIPPGVFNNALTAAGDMVQRPEDLGPLALCLALLRASRAFDPEELQSEMVDAFQLIDKAEKEWRMERAIGIKAGRRH